MIQTGGQDTAKSIFGEGFNNEFHSRLGFERRGILATPPPDPDISPHSVKNDSNFIITVAEECRFLQGKCTVFGRVEGNTIFNAVQISEVEVSKGGRPCCQLLPKILRTEVMENPFGAVAKDLISESAKKVE